MGAYEKAARDNNIVGCIERRIMVKILYPFMVISGVGLAVSAIANIASMVGLARIFEKLIFVLHLGVLVVFIPSVVVFHSRFKKSKDLFGNWLFEGCPTWMSRTVTALFGYGIFAIFIAKVTHSQNLIYYFSSSWLFFLRRIFRRFLC